MDNPAWEERFHGIAMSRYGCGPQIRAGFMLARATETPALAAQAKEKWNLMISRGDYGTEENVLSICQWRPPARVLSADQWLDGLGLR